MKAELHDPLLPLLGRNRVMFAAKELRPGGILVEQPTVEVVVSPQGGCLQPLIGGPCVELRRKVAEFPQPTDMNLLNLSEKKNGVPVRSTLTPLFSRSLPRQSE
ncbi:hypothetical protein V6N13_092934 [Hibiscus sabdariffa]